MSTRLSCTRGTVEGEGLVGLQPYHFLLSYFFKLLMTWIIYELYHLNSGTVTPVMYN